MAAMLSECISFTEQRCTLLLHVISLLLLLLFWSSGQSVVRPHIFHSCILTFCGAISGLKSVVDQLFVSPASFMVNQRIRSFSEVMNQLNDHITAELRHTMYLTPVWWFIHIPLSCQPLVFLTWSNEDVVVVMKKLLRSPHFLFHLLRFELSKDSVQKLLK